ncbi:atp-Dependent helicase [Arthrobacter sp. Hiyo8]|nr:atp-Dependent helicase [Arthrobacter sp. Hiyo8]
MDDAIEVLRELGAIDADGLATDVGKTLARIPPIHDWPVHCWMVPPLSGTGRLPRLSPSWQGINGLSELT